MESKNTSLLSVDEKYEYLVNIFPEADPTYLRKFVEKRTTTNQAFNDFINKNLEMHDYPKKVDYLTRIKANEQINQYVENFNVVDFLKLYPDPVKYFEDKTRKTTYEEKAIEFLKSHFNQHKVDTINLVYRVQKYNLSLAAKTLSSKPSDMKSKRTNSKIINKIEFIPLIHEITYIKNKDEILDYMRLKKEQDKQLFNDLKKKGLLFTCLCCYDECIPSKCSTCDSGHIFCFRCIVRGTELTLANGNTRVRCFVYCKSEFSLKTLQNILPPTKFSTLLMKRQAAEVTAAGIEGLVSCPCCYFASIPPPEDKVFKCLNPECMKESCRLCKKLNHIPLRCDEATKTDDARLTIEEKLTEATLKTCYRCNKKILKEEGCNKITCVCGAVMCYICDKSVDGYDHFYHRDNMNLQLCPLWTDDRRRRDEAVYQVAEEAKVILKKRPDLQNDIKKLFSPKSRRPLGDLTNAEP